MSGGWLDRMRWRRRGAWLWPAFITLTLIDALIGHELPPAGGAQSLISAALVACFLNLIAIILLSSALGALLRRRRGDLPRVVARDYGGTAAILGVAGVLLIVGIAHQPSIDARDQAMRDATRQAQAWIGLRAPAAFRANLRSVNTYAIEPGSIYRACVPSADRQRTYCVVVNTRRGSVSFAGYEPNSVLAAGTN
jgi:hypothetical protein